MSQGGHRCHLENIYAHTLVLVSIAGIYAVWGFGPSRGSPHTVLHIPPHPPLRPFFKVRQRGKGGQGRPSTPGGVRVSRPLPTSQKDDCGDNGKGAVTSWVTRPIVQLRITCAMHANRKSGKASKAKPRKKNKPKPEKVEPKGKGQEGFLGCGCQVGIPTFNTPPQPQPKNPKVK